jgi:hypothetical protein
LACLPVLGFAGLIIAMAVTEEDTSVAALIMSPLLWTACSGAALSDRTPARCDGRPAREATARCCHESPPPRPRSYDTAPALRVYIGRLNCRCNVLDFITHFQESASDC